MIFENKSTIAGIVVKEPKINKTNSGKSICKLKVVVHQKKGFANHSNVIPIAIWGRKGEIAYETIKKGDKILISGSINQEKWESKGGDYRSRIVVKANKFWKTEDKKHNNFEDDYFEDDEDDGFEDDDDFEDDFDEDLEENDKKKTKHKRFDEGIFFEN